MNLPFEYSKDSGTERDLEVLAISAIGAADRAGLLDEVSRRVFDRGAAELVEGYEGIAGVVQLRYRPMVELLLRELTAIGSEGETDPAEQQFRITWTLDMAGF